MNSKNYNLDRLVEELEDRWQFENSRRILRRILIKTALDNKDLDLFRKLIEEEYRNFPQCLSNKSQQSFWETFVSYALIVWVVGCLLGLLIGGIYAFLN